jgi:thiol-disulfide isomerase/thioredoxin
MQTGGIGGVPGRRPGAALLALWCVWAAWGVQACAQEQPDAAPPPPPAADAKAGGEGDGTAPRIGFSGNGKQIWARSFLFAEAPKLEVAKWLGPEPDGKGKFVLIEFWRTWCGACKRAAPLLNRLHEKYAGELVVIAITGQPEETVRTAYHGPELKYFLALDAPGNNPRDKEQGRYEANFGVWGWPHIIIVEPEEHTVVWEGFPGLKDYELTEQKIEKILAIGRESRRAAAPAPAPAPP